MKGSAITGKRFPQSNKFTEKQNLSWQKKTIQKIFLGTIKSFKKESNWWKCQNIEDEEKKPSSFLNQTSSKEREINLDKNCSK